MRIGRWFFVPWAVLLVLGYLALATGNAWLMYLAVSGLGVLVAEPLLRPPRADLWIELAAPARATVGDVTTWRVALANRGRRRTQPVLLTCTSDGYEPLELAAPALAAGERTEVLVPRTAARRAVAPGWSVHVRNPGAWLQWRPRVAVTEGSAPVIVHPPLVPVDVPPPGRASGCDDDAAPSPFGVDVHGVREWRHGDAAHDVHWRTSARRGRLVVVERELPRERRVAVVVTGPADAPRWEELVSVVASTAVDAVERGRSAALLARQDRLAPLCTGRRTALLDWCAALGNPGLPDEQLLRDAVGWLGRGGDLLLAAPLPLPPYVWDAARAVAAPAGVRVGALLLRVPAGVR